MSNSGTVEEFAEEIYQGLKKQLQESLGDLWQENEEIIRRFAYHAGVLNWRIINKERVDTAAKALEDVMEVGIPNLRIALRYKLEEIARNTFWAIVGAFFQGLISLAVAAGKAYLGLPDLDILTGLQDKIKKIV